MKKIFIAITIGLFILTGFAVVQPKLMNKKSKTISNQITASKYKTFTLSELKKYNGQNGVPAYVAVDGVIYDVTTAWGGGFHNGVTAGTDVSKDILRSPHGKSVLKKLPIIGKLKN